MVSTRTIYTRKREEIVGKLLMETVKLCRMSGSNLQKVPLPMLKLMLGLLNGQIQFRMEMQLNIDGIIVSESLWIMNPDKQIGIK